MCPGRPTKYSDVLRHPEFSFGTIINLGSDHATKVGRLNEKRCQSWLRSECRVDRVEEQEVSLQHSTKLLGSDTHLYSITHDFPVLCNKDKNFKAVFPPDQYLPYREAGWWQHH